MVSSVPHISTRPKTQAQLNQQLKFAAVASSLSVFKELIVAGFSNISKTSNTFNTAIRYNFRDIIEGTWPDDYAIDCSKLIYSVGKQAVPNMPKVKLAATDVVLFNWSPDTQGQFTRDTDKATFVAYNQVKKMVVISPAPHTIRSALTYNLVLPAGFSIDPLHCYMSFASADEKIRSDSVYLVSERKPLIFLKKTFSAIFLAAAPGIRSVFLIKGPVFSVLEGNLGTDPLFWFPLGIPFPVRTALYSFLA